MTPLHKAVIEGNAEWVTQLKGSAWRYQLERNGFTPLELAQLLGQRQCEERLQNLSPFTIKVQLKDQTFPKFLGITEFEKTFKMTYRPFLTFPSYQTLEDIIRSCPFFIPIGMALWV